MIIFKIFEFEYKPEWVNLNAHMYETIPEFRSSGGLYRRCLIGKFLQDYYNAVVTFKDTNDWRFFSEKNGIITFETEQDFMFFKLRFS